MELLFCSLSTEERSSPTHSWPPEPNDYSCQLQSMTVELGTTSVCSSNNMDRPAVRFKKQKNNWTFRFREGCPPGNWSQTSWEKRMIKIKTRKESVCVQNNMSLSLHYHFNQLDHYQMCYDYQVKSWEVHPSSSISSSSSTNTSPPGAPETSHPEE